MTRCGKIAWGCALLLLCVSVYVQFVSGYAGDRNWLLLAGRMWLGGKQLYTDIFEINPPLIIWICALAVFLADHSGFLADYQMLALMGCAAVALTIWVASRLLAAHPEGDGRNRAQFALLLAFTLIVWTNPAYFFDREHIFLMLTLPYVLRWMPSLAGTKPPLALRVLVGLMAGFGYSMKPHTVIAFAVVQLLFLLRERSTRILFSLENILIYAVAGVYVSLVVLLTPDYLHTVLPMALETYSGYGRKLPGISFLLAALFILAVTFVDFRPRHRSPYRRDILYFLGVCLGYLLYALANNGWGYAYNPLISMLLITAGWVYGEFRYLKRQALAQGDPAHQFGFGMRDCCMVFFVNTAFTFALYAVAFTSSCSGDAVCKLQDRFTQVMKDDNAHSFGTITTTFVFWPPLAKETGAQWNTRFNHLWMLPEFFDADDTFRAKHRWVIDYVANALADDMNRKKPEVMFVDNNQTFASGRLHVNLAEYFSAYPVFREAFSHYRFERSIVSCAHPERTVCQYDVYRRENP